MKIRSGWKLKDDLAFRPLAKSLRLVSLCHIIFATTTLAQERMPVEVLAQQYAAGLNLNLSAPARYDEEARHDERDLVKPDERAARRWQVLQSWALDDAVQEEITRLDKANNTALPANANPATPAETDRAPLSSSSSLASSSAASSRSFINWQEDFTIYAPQEDQAEEGKKLKPISRSGDQLNPAEVSAGVVDHDAALWANAAAAEDLDFTETMAVFYQTLASVQQPFQKMDEQTAIEFHWPKIGPEAKNKFWACLKKLKPYLPAAKQGNTKALVYFNKTRAQKDDFYCASFLGIKLAVPAEDLIWNVQFLNAVGQEDAHDLALGYFLNAYSAQEDPAAQRWWQLAWQLNFQYWMLGKSTQVLPGDQLRQIFAHAKHGMTSLSSVQRLSILESGLHYIQEQGLAN